MSDLSDWRALAYAPPPAMVGQHSQLERLSVGDHAAALHASNPLTDDHWAFMPYGPFPDLQVYRLWAEGAAASEDPAYYAVRGGQGWGGVASLMRIDRAHGVIEIGHIAFSPGLQRTTAATEAIHLMIDQAFAAGFRRVEWKCNAANAASRHAAERLGFVHEGTFRQHMVVKGANRDTAWYAILDGDWPRLRAAHRAWLAPSNFEADGRQRTPLRV
ncbi:GNAT family N-acetyltransferase [Jannaschia sp. S6380]|uniref:GNAT family N-acetyltransferase n=1 Tax=Jannaschia sp. S6380 TaxID=2926408 RepID=UPI001FF4000D|nr:GNAT family protein [Jannaschia sp. S6380]MCK0167965.1 GNAT family N-acetyltransferase [Jannaschia sp. S6380]